MRVSLRPILGTIVASLIVLASSGAASAASHPAGGSVVVADADFGSPPSGEIPILYNDHHVYARPDTLRVGRVLAALVRNGTILVPLRSMFEQMGATVSYDAGAKSFTITKSGASIVLTLGQNQATINGESRPLDQGPIMYHGVALVPIRVISESMGAYVEWEPSQRLAIVRYAPPAAVASPMPTAPPTPIPTPAPPTPPPTPMPAAANWTVFVAGGITGGRNYNEFSSGQYCNKNSYVASGAFRANGTPFAVKVDFRQDDYVTNNDVSGNFTKFGTIDGGTALTPVFRAQQSTLDARLEYFISAPQIYGAIGYIRTSDNYGYPALNGVGIGAEKLPELTQGISFFGSAFYYFNASGNYTVNEAGSTNFGLTFKQQYDIVKYDIGAALSARHVPVYLYGGWSGDRYIKKSGAPIDQTHGGPYVGLGIKI
jgi:Copper amine oxidase N-terminal domain